MRERKYWIDYLKAIAIYLVILGHLPDELHRSDLNFSFPCTFSQ